MGRDPKAKKERQNKLIDKLKEDPFLTDEDLAEQLSVSVPTIRLDRLELGVPELRQRVRDMASKNHDRVRSLSSEDIIGEIVELNLGRTQYLFWIPPIRWYLQTQKLFVGIIYIPWLNPLLLQLLMPTWP